MHNCSETDPWGNPNNFQCSYGCCGSKDFVYCCSSNGKSYVPKTWQPDLPGYAIAAVTGGCILGLIVVIGVVYALCRHVKKKDKFLEEAINRLRVPPAKAATGRINATTKMYPGPRRDVISLPTYVPRESRQLTSTPIPSPVVPAPVSQPPTPRRIGFKSRATKNQNAKEDKIPAKGTANSKLETKRKNGRNQNPANDVKNSGKAGADSKTFVTTADKGNYQDQTKTSPLRGKKKK